MTTAVSNSFNGRAIRDVLMKLSKSINLISAGRILRVDDVETIQTMAETAAGSSFLLCIEKLLPERGKSPTCAEVQKQLPEKFGFEESVAQEYLTISVKSGSIAMPKGGAKFNVQESNTQTELIIWKTEWDQLQEEYKEKQLFIFHSIRVGITNG